MGVVHAKLIVSGAVQKAGYRDVVGEAAFNFKLKGYVKNQKNGTVEIVCEGEKSAIEKFAQKINFQKYPIIVDNVKVEFSKATGKFKSFDIEREKDVTAATFERMDVAARYMREMNDNLGNKMDGLGNNLGNKIDSLGSNLGKDIRGIGDKVDNMADRMDANFEQIRHQMTTRSSE
ncbi:MAG: acylphosphatase [Thermoplasmata archaeon]